MRGIPFGSFCKTRDAKAAAISIAAWGWLSHPPNKAQFEALEKQMTKSAHGQMAASAHLRKMLWGQKADAKFMAGFAAVMAARRLVQRTSEPPGSPNFEGWSAILNEWVPDLG